MAPLLPRSFLQNVCHSGGLNGKSLQRALRASPVLGILASIWKNVLVFSVPAVDVFGILADGL